MEALLYMLLDAERYSPCLQNIRFCMGLRVCLSASGSSNYVAEVPSLQQDPNMFQTVLKQLKKTRQEFSRSLTY